MSFTIKGKVIEICPEQSGVSASTGNAWSKRDFVIEEIEGQYPKRIAFTAFNKQMWFSNLEVHDEVTVGFNAESKEYQGRWFTNLSAWKLEVQQKDAGSSAPPPPPPPPEEPSSTTEPEGDLPF